MFWTEFGFICSAMNAPCCTWARLRQTCERVHAHYLLSHMRLVVAEAAAVAPEAQVFRVVRDLGKWPLVATSSTAMQRLAT